MKLAILALALTVPLRGANLAESIRLLIDSSAVARTGFWGIEVLDLATGKTIYELNPNHHFVPASNTKLFTTALALARLGPDYRFATRVLADAAPDAAGRIAGGIRLVGGGDPNLSARPIPYRMGAITGDPLAAIEDLADQLVARGVRRIDGDITGDDTWYTWQPYATGWGIDDPQSDDGPPISALTLSDNVVTLNVNPGAVVGEPAALSFSPVIEVYDIENRVRTVAVGGERSIRLKRVPGSRYAQLWGTIPLRDRGETFLMSVEDPAEYAARALMIALQERGVSVGGQPASRHLFPDEVADLLQGPGEEPAGGIELARRISAPLVEDLRITDKVSQNLHAELALRAVAKARRNVGSFEAGREEMKQFLGEVGIDSTAYNLMDGSGLSRLNLVTPHAVVQLLNFMYGAPVHAEWISLLPVGGQDGTLSARFGQTPVAGKVYAKTGSLSHVSTLSGYIERSGGTWVAFSILVNNYPGPASGVRGIMDRICNLIWE
jgi:serine-type D-Ala-D-Ala carboxypeptidase/endopeptidase (penicillin-binding protein 4)